MRHEGAQLRHKERQAQNPSSQWFDILAFPTSPDGFTLDLTANTPRHIARRHKICYTRVVERLRAEKEGKPGYHDGTKVNIHPTLNPQNPNVISYTATPTTYSDFLALSERRIPKALQEQIRLSGVQALWYTTEPDGGRKAVFEIRSEHTGIYPSAPGTIGGSIDGKLDYVGSLGESAVLHDASPRHIVAHALKESHEELGIPETTLRTYLNGENQTVISGVVKDKKRNYYDVLLQGTLPYSQTEVQKLYEQHKVTGDDIHDPMPKRLMFVDATPDSFARLLTTYLIPLTPVTQASFLLGGYILKMREVLQTTGNQNEAVQAAMKWKNDVMAGMTEKDATIDAIARSTRKHNLQQARKKFWHTLLSEPVRGNAKEKYATWRRVKRQPRGYDTAQTPEAQGLKPVVEELQATHYPTHSSFS